MRHFARAGFQFLRADHGATMVEYGIVILIVAVLAVAAVKEIGHKVSKGFQSINSQLP